MTNERERARSRRGIRLRDIDVLLAVGQVGSMGKTADVLRLSQPAISKATAQRGRAVGVRLLDRSRQGVEPTMHGRALMKRAVAVFDELDRGMEELDFLNDPKAGEIRVGGSEDMVSSLFQPVLQPLLRSHPRMKTSVAIGDFNALARQLEERQIDVVVSRLYRPPSHEYAVDVLFEDPIVVVADASHPIRRRRKVGLEDLIDQAWTLQPPGNTFSSAVLDVFRAANLVAPEIKVASTSYNLRRTLLATGRYLTAMPRFSVLLPRPHPALKILPVELPGTQHQVAIVSLKKRSVAPATQRFVEALRALTKPIANKP